MSNIKHLIHYDVEQKEYIISICDRLIEDTQRRKDGAFFTPTIWVNEAHKMIEEQLVLNWKNEYIVWDCACGTGNLTRDYNFKELYCSTLNESEIDIMKKNHINDEATRFQYDFLNDDLNKLPQSLQLALNDGKKILIFINPPYGTANTKTASSAEYRNGIALTKINLEMNENNIGACSQNLYAQFLYKIYTLNSNKNISIALFSPSLFLTGGSYKKFRKEFFKKFEFNYGMMFQASHFSDVSAEWGIMFSIWKSGITINNEFNIELKDDIIEEII